MRWNPPDNPNGEIVNYTVEFAVISTNFPAVPIRSKRQTEILVECVNGGVNRSTVVPGTQTSVTLTQLSRWFKVTPPLLQKWKYELPIVLFSFSTFQHL